MIPATAPMANNNKTGMLRVETAPIIYAYLPIKSRMNAPEIPGSIIAQIAMAPDKIINHQASGVAAGLRTVMT